MKKALMLVWLMVASSAVAQNIVKVKLDTTAGPVIIEVHPEWAPIGAARFEERVKAGFFDGARFFRVIPGFMAQFGINGSPAVQKKWSNANLRDEPVKTCNSRGTLAYGQIGGKPNTRSTQVFINYKENGFLNRDFAPFAKVISGMEFVDKLYSAYGEKSNNQAMIESQGNAYLTKNFPKLDYIKKATIEK